MANLMKKLILVAMLSLVVFGTVKALEITSYVEADQSLRNYDYIEDAKLASSRYTRVDDLSIVDPELFIDIRSSDDLIASNDNFELYYNEDIVSFKIKDLETGYVWSTAIRNADAPVAYEGLLESGIGIDYILVDKNLKVQENVGISNIAFEEEYTLTDDGIDISLDLGGYCGDFTCKRAYEGYLIGEVTLDEMIEQYGFAQINVSFDLQVRLTDTGIQATVPVESIEEKNPESKLLSSIILFPGLGATEMDTIPGYMVIPDGAGALIRYEDNDGQFNTPLIERYFGGNLGLEDRTESVTNYGLSMPIFGAVHGVNQNAFIGIIEGAQFNSRLFAFPNGARNIPYNLIFPKFDYTQIYRQSYLSDGTGGIGKTIKTLNEDISVKYNFLNNDDADYVGIGKDYRNYLIDNDKLEKQNQTGDIGVYLNYLMSDTESSFFGSNLVKMSTVNQVDQMYDYFINQGLVNQKVGLMGWNDGGYSGSLPSKVDYENALGSNRSFANLITHINEQNSVMLQNNYLVASNDTSRVSYRQDVAEGVNKFKIEDTCPDCVHKDFYLLYPESSSEFATKDYDDYVDANVGVLFENLSHTLYSYYDGDFNYREDSYTVFKEIMEMYDGIGNYSYPFSYAFEYVESYYDAPLYNSQLKYYDDVIPLINIVLKGSMDLYSQFLNYNSLGNETILNIIDFGLNPSYVLTYEPSSMLKHTDLGRFFTTEFDLWKETVTSEYTYINNALKYVNGESIESRVVVELGIVQVTYSNDVIIYINYTADDYDIGDITIPSMDYYVGGVS